MSYSWWSLFKSDLDVELIKRQLGPCLDGITQHYEVSEDFEDFRGGLAGPRSTEHAQKLLDFIGNRMHDEDFRRRIRIALAARRELKSILQTDPPQIPAAPTAVTPVSPPAHPPALPISPSPLSHEVVKSIDAETVHSKRFEDIRSGNSVDKKNFSLHRDGEEKPIYLVSLTYTKPIECGGSECVVMTFHLKRGEDHKRCKSLDLKGEISGGGIVKEIRPPPPLANVLDRTSVQVGETQDMRGGIEIKQVPGATLAYAQTSSIQFEVKAGQTMETDFDASSFVMKLGLEKIYDSKLPQEIANPAEINIAVHSGKTRVFGELKLSIEVSYESDAHLQLPGHRSIKELSHSFAIDLDGSIKRLGN